MLIEKYRIKNKEQIYFNKELYYNLLNYRENEDILNEIEFLKESPIFCLKKYKKFYKNKNKEKFDKFKKLPNLLIHGNTSSGKKSLIKLLLHEIYGPNVHKTNKIKYFISGYSNSDVEIEIEQSNFHIIIEPNNTGFDKYVIQEIVKEYAKKNIMQVFKNKIPFKIILINNVDNLSYYAQTSLRCTMERYHETCKFILCGYQISKIIEPLRSRCLNIRIPCPSDDKLFNYLMYIKEKEKLKISIQNINYIIKTSNNNINTCLWNLDFFKNKEYDFSISWKTYLSGVTKIIYITLENKKVINIYLIMEMRNIINNILITNISGSEIVNELLEQLLVLKHYNDDLYFNIINIFSDFEIRISKGKRSIIHIEALIMKVLCFCYSYKKN
jgi:replication factor C subunit 3/5